MNHGKTTLRSDGDCLRRTAGRRCDRPGAACRRIAAYARAGGAFAVLLGGARLSAVAVAQTTGKLEEIVVTAQKRGVVENAQDVPLAIFGFSGDSIVQAQAWTLRADAEPAKGPRSGICPSRSKRQRRPHGPPTASNRRPSQ